ncbi:hypothetical protein EDD36DRAFT_424702 [Exophiala viscosa]|uniref:Uncharacterized protein n=1 Tax=Exophiala viscosa TaxID=2486360 RepID=A0AAN6E479_9EURO|nr:hypothetical protein EDD36DRAFT_424702 [Exophiala viscosa]
MVDAQQEPAQPEMQAVDEEQRQPVPPLFYVPRIPLQPVPSQPVPSQPVPSLAQFQQQPGTLQFQGQRQLPPFSSLGQQQLPPFSPQGQQQRISSNFGQQAPTSSVFGAQQEPIQSCGDDMVLDEAEDSMVVDDAAPDDLPADDSDMQVDSNQPTLWGHPTSEPALQDHMQPAPASIPEGGYMAADGVIELPTYAGIEAPFQPPPRPSNANAPVSFNMINGSRQVPDAVNPPPRPSNANAPVSFTMISGPRQVPDAMDQGQEVFTGTAFRQMVPNENTTMADASQNSSDAGINFGRTDHNTSVNLGQTDNTSRVNFGNNSQQHISERDDEMAELSPDAPSDQVPRDPPPVATVEKILELANDMPWHIWAGMDTTQAMETTANGRIVGNWQWMADNPGYFMFVDGRNYLEGPWGAQFLEEYGSIVMKKLLEINAGT